MKRNKILVVGGAGYIGSFIVDALVKDYDVLVYDNLSTGLSENVNKDATFILGDVHNVSEYERVFKENTIDLVVYLAALTKVEDSEHDPQLYYLSNLLGIINTLKIMELTNVNKIIFASSGSVYGSKNISPITEDSILFPESVYADTKAISESIIKQTAKNHDLKYLIFRFFNAAGADSNLNLGIKTKTLTHLIPIVAEAVLEKRSLSVFGTDYDTRDGTCIRDYIHVKDIADANVLGVKYLLANNPSETINLGTNDGYSVKEIIDIALKLNPNLKYDVKDRRLGDASMQFASTAKAKSILDFEAKRKIDEIVESEYQFRKNLNDK